MKYRKIDSGTVIGISIDSGHYIIQTPEGHFYTLLRERMMGTVLVGDDVFIYYRSSSAGGWKVFSKEEITENLF